MTDLHKNPILPPSIKSKSLSRETEGSGTRKEKNVWLEEFLNYSKLTWIWVVELQQKNVQKKKKIVLERIFMFKCWLCSVTVAAGAFVSPTEVIWRASPTSAPLYICCTFFFCLNYASTKLENKIPPAKLVLPTIIQTLLFFLSTRRRREWWCRSSGFNHYREMALLGSITCVASYYIAEIEGTLETKPNTFCNCTMRRWFYILELDQYGVSSCIYM